ncbi:MAG TPA: ROK family protein [Candidatus Xenobia bacterium]|jgi:glucokinase
MTTADTPLVLGIDIGGTQCAVAVGDGQERVLAHTRWPSEVEKGPQAMIRRMTDEARRLLGRIPGRLAGIGVGCGGPLDRLSGIVLNPPNLPGWERVNLTARLAAILNAPAWLDNDANVGALGEYRHGAGRGASNMIYVTVSTGIGAGIILNGQTWYGVADSAGEIGHQTVLLSGAKCTCGNTGCLETVASGTAIGREARDAVTNDRGVTTRPLLAAVNGQASTLNAQHVADLARTGDPLARRIWLHAVSYLAIGIGNLITTLAPSRVIIGGGVAAAGDVLFEPLREALRERVRLVPMDQVEVVPAALGTDSVLRGAISLALQCVAEKRPIAPRPKTGRRASTGTLRT